MSEAKTIRGYHLKRSKGLEHWDALLEEWLLAHERYCRIMKGSGDPAAYWYAEIPNVSILSAAAWRCGRIALQEFSAEKIVQDEGTKAGRADLWIRTDTDGKEEFIEAKHKFVSLSGIRDKDGLPAITTAMDYATEDANGAKGRQHGVTALAVVFASAYTLKSSIKKRRIEERVVEIDKQIKEFCETIKSSADYHASAWCFPKETRTLRNPKGKYYYPGIAILVKNIDFE